MNPPRIGGLTEMDDVYYVAFYICFFAVVGVYYKVEIAAVAAFLRNDKGEKA